MQMTKTPTGQKKKKKAIVSSDCGIAISDLWMRSVFKLIDLIMIFSDREVLKFSGLLYFSTSGIDASKS